MSVLLVIYNESIFHNVHELYVHKLPKTVMFRYRQWRYQYYDLNCEVLLFCLKGL